MTPLPTYNTRNHPTRVYPKEATPRISVTRHTRPTHREHRNRPTALTLALIIVAGILGGVSVFAWDRTGSRNGSGALEDAMTQRDAALGELATLNGRLDGLRAGLTAARAEATALRDAVAQAEAELVSMLGPALDDGRYFGSLIALGAIQKPPRLLIDIEQWFTDQEAIAAAIEDGVIAPGEIIPNGYYIRNENPRWRTIEIDPATGVTLKTYPFADPSQPTTIALDEFGELFSAYEGRFLPSSPYWIAVEDGTVVAIEEQFIP